MKLSTWPKALTTPFNLLCHLRCGMAEEDAPGPFTLSGRVFGVGMVKGG
jgi:hypothetical protein